MYIYVPDCLATKPPVLVCSHYCGGSAAAMFGIAGGGGLVKQADQLGFIMIFPQAVNPDGSGRCWDVGSTKSLTHDGGGDTTAIAQMVKYALGKYGANPDRVYASGTSSGAMMTEALLAIYPDVFKAGVEFSGVPAGCWAVGASSDGTWSGPCAGGQVSHTAAEWGDIARKMYPSYSGHRPRVQLWHGDADTTISFKNHTEGIKQWTNVLGLATDSDLHDNGLVREPPVASAELEGHVRLHRPGRLDRALRATQHRREPKRAVHHSVLRARPERAHRSTDRPMRWIIRK